MRHIWCCTCHQLSDSIIWSSYSMAWTGKLRNLKCFKVCFPVMYYYYYISTSNTQHRLSQQNLRQDWQTCFLLIAHTHTMVHLNLLLFIGKESISNLKQTMEALKLENGKNGKVISEIGQKTIIETCVPFICGLVCF